MSLMTASNVTLHVPLTAETNDPINEDLLMMMPKDATPNSVACPEEVHEAELLRTSACKQTSVTSPRCRTGVPRKSGHDEGDSRTISIRVHSTVPRHLVVSTSNAESVEVSEDASELSRVREPARSRRSSLFTGSTSSQRSRCNPDVRDAFAHEDMDDTETMTLTRGDHAFGKMQSSPIDQPFEPLARSLWNDQSQNQEIARSMTQQVHKQSTKPEPLFVERIDEVRLRTSPRFPRSDLEGHQADSKSGGSIRGETCEHAQTDICQHAAVEQVQLRCELVKRSCLSKSIQHEQSKRQCEDLSGLADETRDKPTVTKRSRRSLLTVR